MVEAVQCANCGGEFAAGQEIGEDYNERKAWHADQRDCVWGAAIDKSIVSIYPQGHDGTEDGPIVIELSGGQQIVITGAGLFSGGAGMDIEVKASFPTDDDAPPIVQRIREHYGARKATTRARPT